MRFLDLLKRKIKLVSILVTREELKSVLALTVLEPPQGARYKIGDTIHTAGVGSALGNFKVYGIKAGGYGFAYIVLDEETLTPYCIKTIRDRFSDGPGRVENFKREAETWIRLGKHPHLVYAHAVLDIGGRPHILFEYAAGSDLWRQIKNGPIPIRVALKYAIQFCRGMVYAQSKLPGFVHGDIKPNNCLLTQDNTLKISDFGQVDFWAEHQELSKIPPPDKPSSSSTQILNTPISNWRVGTPPYMAPEQFDPANKTDARSDVYAFGVMLFEMLTGTRPFKGKRHKECFAQHREAIPPDPLSLNPEIPRPLARLILSCLAKSPKERPGDFKLLENELSSLLWSTHQEQVPSVASNGLTDVEQINRGISLMALDHYDEALAYFDNLLSIRPRLARAWCHKGDVLSSLGRADEALSCFDRALDLDSQLAFAWGNKGQALDILGRYEEALECFDQALALDAQLAFVWNNKGHSLTNLGQLVESLPCLNRALAIDPHHVETHNNLGIAYHKLGRDEEAIEKYKQAISLNPQYAEAHYNLGDAYSRAGRLKQAIESYKQAIGAKPDYEEACRSLGNAYREFYSTSKQFVGEPYVEAMIAFLLGDQNDPEVILSTSINFLQLSNFAPKVFYLCSNKIYRALKRINRQQKETLLDILAKVRENIFTLEPDRDAFYWLGKIYYGLNLYDECLEVFHQSIILSGPDDKAFYYIAACNEISGDHKIALDYYKQALIFDPGCQLTLAGIKRMEAQLALQSAPENAANDGAHQG